MAKRGVEEYVHGTDGSAGSGGNRVTTGVTKIRRELL